MEVKIQDFDESELKFLKDLKFVFDNLNPGFVKGLNVEYAPIGVLIVQAVTFRNFWNKNAFADNESVIYAKLVNREYLNLALRFKLAIEGGLTLFDQRSNTPFPHDALIKIINNLENGDDDSYSGILAFHVAYDELLDALAEMRGVAKNDSYNKSIRTIANEMKKGNVDLQPQYLSNSILYSPVKDCLITKREPVESELSLSERIKSAARVNEKRQLVLIEYLKKHHDYVAEGEPIVFKMAAGYSKAWLWKTIRAFYLKNVETSENDSASIDPDRVFPAVDESTQNYKRPLTVINNSNSYFKFI